jgi:hypothetical protein
MKATIYLRIASVLALVHSALHTIGGVFGKPTPGAASVAVAAMQANEFVVFGVTRTYFQFLRGMGLAVTIFLTVEAVIFWILAGMVKEDGRRLRPMLAVFTVAYLAMAVNSYAYFFSAPVIVETLIAVCLGLSWISAGAQVSTEDAVPVAVR